MKTEETEHGSKLLWVLCIFLCLFFVGIYLYVFCGGFSTKQEDFGTFGDYIGGTLGAVFGIISIYYIYKTYKEQVSASINQKRMAELTQFESAFFALLDGHRAVKESIHIIKGTDHILGIKALDEAALNLQANLLKYEYEKNDFTKVSFSELRKELNTIYSQSMNELGEASVAHYFRNLYNLLNYITQTEYSVDKEKYVRLVQSQMSNNELFLLFFNALSDYGFPKMHEQVVIYSMLENLRYNEFPYFKPLKRFCYPTMGFKDQTADVIFFGSAFSGPHESIAMELMNKYNIGLIDIEGQQQHTNRAHDVKKRKSGDFDTLISDYSKCLVDGNYCSYRGQIGFSIDTFRKVNPVAMICFYEDYSDVLKKQYNADHIKHGYPEDQFYAYQDNERNHAEYISSELRVPLLVCSSNEKEKIEEFVKSHLSL